MKALMQLIASAGNLKAILAGHKHVEHFAPLPCGVMQYCLGGAHEEYFYRLTID